MWVPRWFPSTRSSPEGKRFGYAVVGTGHGAKKMCEALARSPVAQVVAVVSSSVEKAEAFGRRYGVQAGYTYGEFGRLADDAAVDAVYLALPVGMHREFSERACVAGKHVLCEKPMASTVAEAEAMIAAAGRAERLLMVAYRLDYDPMHAEAARLLDEGVLGQVRFVHSKFGIVAKDGWRFDPALAGGGSLFDVGVYPLHALRKLFGEPSITSADIIEAADNGMELDATWRGKLPGGVEFECRSSYLERIPDELHVEGERGTLALRHAFAYGRTRILARWRDSAGRDQQFRARDSMLNPSLFRLEAEHLAHCAHTGAALRSPGESGLRDLMTVARIEAVAKRTRR